MPVALKDVPFELAQVKPIRVEANGEAFDFSSIEQDEQISVQLAIGVGDAEFSSDRVAITYTYSVNARIATFELGLRATYRYDDSFEAIRGSITESDWRDFFTTRGIPEITAYARVYLGQLCGILEIPPVPLVIK
ncbi:hypothetical protein [Arcanobacterium bovis]|uniref:Preprotein translocase subunit SecB n=1 Tax=Arcanobacterium bovis TaxID=2529275 RepID=A0A4V2KR58_9ACTO|nr:hypothetical protein [Arcanobacterium bovis]TBW22242.1 hypothetical protein EZJ44_05335 [Arcanobacterium bovis]